jgi:hypothetical protein
VVTDILEDPAAFSFRVEVGMYIAFIRKVEVVG